jgi:hypothetical protein
MELLSVECRLLVGRGPRELPLARCPPDGGFAYDCVHFLFSLAASELT